MIYIRGTKLIKLCLGDLIVKYFSNLNFVGDQDDHKSTSGHVFLFGGATVSWSSNKQTRVVRYTMEAEVTYALWIGHFIEELKIDLLNKPINVFCDNKSLISLIKSGSNNSKGKYTNVSYHYIQDIEERRNKNKLYFFIRDGGSLCGHKFK